MTGEIKVDFGEMDRKNQSNIKDTKDGKSVSFIAMRKLVLIGSGHKKEYVDFVNSAEAKTMFCSGLVWVDKGGVLDKGELKVKGCTKSKAEFEDAIKRISKKKVTHI